MKTTLLCLAVGMTAAWAGSDPSAELSSSNADAPDRMPHPPFPLVLDAWAASWSPDNRQMVFTRPNRNGLEILDLTSLERWIAIREGKDPVWSPDGRHLAYVTEPSTDAYTAERVWIADTNGRNARAMASGGYPRWSVDGTKVFFHDRQSNQVMSIRVDPTDAQPEVFFRNALSWYPAVSPDEEQIAFGQQGFLKIVDRATGSVIRQIETPGDRGLLPSWSPDGRWVTFGGFNDSQEGLRVLDVKTGGMAVLISGSFTLPVWSPDGSRLCVDYRGPDGYAVLVVGRPYVEARLQDRVPLWDP